MANIDFSFSVGDQRLDCFPDCQEKNSGKGIHKSDPGPYNHLGIASSNWNSYRDNFINSYRTGSGSVKTTQKPDY
jgi:hypothetical protein